MIGRFAPSRRRSAAYEARLKAAVRPVRLSGSCLLDVNGEKFWVPDLPLLGLGDELGRACRRKLLRLPIHRPTIVNRMRSFSGEKV
jgi:hypothetical protein